MSLRQRLEMIEQNVRAALEILDGTADGTGENPELEAQELVYGGYAFTPAPDSPVIAVLSVGAPDVQMIRDGDGYALTAYSPGRAEAVLRSETVTRWGRMIDTEAGR